MYRCFLASPTRYGVVRIAAAFRAQTRPASASMPHFGPHVFNQYIERDQISLPATQPDRFIMSHASCTAELVMMDNRNITAHRVASKTTMLNLLYTRRHGIQFLLARPALGPWRTHGTWLTWCKVKLLEQIVARWLRQASNRPCHWLAFLDSDAIVREQSLNFIDLMPDADLVIAREQPVPSMGLLGTRSLAGGVNTGVMFMKATKRLHALLRAWVAAHDALGCVSLHATWPYEQRCLDLMLQGKHELGPNSSSITANGGTGGANWSDLVALHLLPMQAINSPWGRFVRHTWSANMGLHNQRLRDSQLDDEMRTQGIGFNDEDGERMRAELLRSVTSPEHTLRFEC